MTMCRYNPTSWRNGKRACALAKRKAAKVIHRCAVCGKGFRFRDRVEVPAFYDSKLFCCSGCSQAWWLKNKVVNVSMTTANSTILVVCDHAGKPKCYAECWDNKPRVEDKSFLSRGKMFCPAIQEDVRFIPVPDAGKE